MCPSNFENLHQYDNLRFDVTDLNSALFNLLDIEKFESDHPELFPISPLAQANKRIAELERQIEEVRLGNENLKTERGGAGRAPLDCGNCQSGQDAKQRIDELEASNLNLQSRLDAALTGRPRWLPSCIALFQASKQVIESDRGDWIKDEFFSLAESLYVNPGDNQGVLGEAREEAWKALPKQFKAGPGNQKNKGNPTKE